MADKREPLELGPFTVGDEKTITIATCVHETGADKDVSSGTFAFWDDDGRIKGMADSGSTTTLVDATLNTYDDDTFNGIPLDLRYANGTMRRTVVTDFTGSSGTLTFAAQPNAIAADDEYELLGKPLLAQTAADSISTNTASIQLTSADAFAYEGDFPGVYRPDFGTDAQAQPLLLKVRVPERKP